MAKLSNISNIDRLLEEQKESEISKWSELTVGKIYEITKFEIIEINDRKSGIITISNDFRVWSPSCLTEKLSNFDLASGEFTTHVRPTGQAISKRGLTYYTFNLVKEPVIFDEDSD